MSSEHQTKTSYLNIGCGHHFFNGEPWVNLDVAPADASVMVWDVRTGFPMRTNSFDVVYLSHVLEHFSKESGARLVMECHRALKPGGILRVVVPDLEGICREYLKNLNEVRTVSSKHINRLAWSKLELLDQCIRHESGGNMRTFFRDHGRDELEYVVDRIGTVGLNLAKACVPSVTGGKIKHRLRLKLGGLSWDSLRGLFLKALLSEEEAEALRVGQFRLRGEVHLCMYEDVSLKQLLIESGFMTVTSHRADSSQIVDWERYYLDRDRDGNEHAPHSLYVEGRKHS